jgi:hypothetical protein
MFATAWIRNAEAVMAAHPNHPLSGYKLREVARVCTECKGKKVGKSYSKCYTCRKTSHARQHISQWEDAQNSWSKPNEYERMPSIDEKHVVTFTRGQESCSEPNECNPTKHDVEAPLVTFTYLD